jgi:hypothetical protein
LLINRVRDVLLAKSILLNRPDFLKREFGLNLIFGFVYVQVVYETSLVQLHTRMDNNNANPEGQRKRRKKRPNPLKPLIVRWKLDGEASSNTAESSENQENPPQHREEKLEQPQWSNNSSNEAERVDRKRRYSVASPQEFLQTQQNKDSDEEYQVKRRRLMSVPDVSQLMPPQPNQIPMNDRNIPPFNPALWAATPLNNAQLAELNQQRRRSLGDIFCPDISSTLTKYITDRNRFNLPPMPFMMPMQPLIVPDGTNPLSPPPIPFNFAFNIPHEQIEAGMMRNMLPAGPLTAPPTNTPPQQPKLTDLLNSAEQSDVSLSVLAAVCNDKQSSERNNEGDNKNINAGKSSAETTELESS